MEYDNTKSSFRNAHVEMRFIMDSIIKVVWDAKCDLHHSFRFNEIIFLANLMILTNKTTDPKIETDTITMNEIVSSYP